MSTKPLSEDYLNNIHKMVEEARRGDPAAREEVLESVRPVAKRITENFCHRSLSWENDDELSVAFISCNAAIDRFQAEKGKNFIGFLKLVIESRLKDHFRKENKEHHLSLVICNRDEEEFSSAEIKEAWDNYHRQCLEEDRALELDDFETYLEYLGITMLDLVEHSPKHKDTRESLIKAARTMAGDEKMMQCLTKTGHVPLSELSLRSEIHSKTLERFRKYLIAMALLLSKLDEFPHLGSYIKVLG